LISRERQIVDGKGKKSKKDDRITIKIDRALGNAIGKMIQEHPEWGIGSVSEFIRRSLDREMEYRRSIGDRKVVEINLTPGRSR